MRQEVERRALENHKRIELHKEQILRQQQVEEGLLHVDDQLSSEKVEDKTKIEKKEEAFEEGEEELEEMAENENQEVIDRKKRKLEMLESFK